MRYVAHTYSGGVGRVGEVGQMDNLYLLDIAKMPPINHCDYMYRIIIHGHWGHFGDVQVFTRGMNLPGFAR